MLQTSTPTILNNMAAANSTLCIIGRKQKLTDLPPFSYLRDVITFDGRNYSDVAGVGAVQGAPNSAVTESNLLWLEGDPYNYDADNWESIAVHEMGHAIEDIGIGAATLLAAQQAFSASLAKWSKQFSADHYTPYAWSNWAEYWAVMTEAWFQSTTRTDINEGILTRSQLRSAEPSLAALFLGQVYGASTWSYISDTQLPHNVSKSGAGRRSAAATVAGGGAGDEARGTGGHRGPSRSELRALAAKRQPHEVWVRP